MNTNAKTSVTDDTPSKTGRLLNRNYIAMAMTNCIYQMAHQMHFTILPLLLEAMKASGTMIGLMNTLNVFAGMILRPILGKQYDKRNKKRLMVISLSLVALCAFGIGTSSVWKVLALIMIFRTLQGMGSAAVTTGGNTLIASAIPRERMAEAFGYYNAISIAGTAFSPVIALFFVNKTGLSGSLFITAGFFGATVLILGLIYRTKTDVSSVSDTSSASNESDSTQPADYHGIWKYIEKAVVPFAMLVFLYFFATCAGTNFLVLYAENKGYHNISLYYTMTTVFILLARLISEPLRRKFGEQTVLVLGLFFLVGGYALITLMPSMYLINTAGILVGLGNGLCNPMLMALCMSSAPASRYGVASSTYCLAIDLGICISSTLWGGIVDLFGYQATFACATGVLIFMVVLCIPIFRMYTRRQ